jgi:hypothetical protein
MSAPFWRMTRCMPSSFSINIGVAWINQGLEFSGAVAKRLNRASRSATKKTRARTSGYNEQLDIEAVRDHLKTRWQG